MSNRKFVYSSLFKAVIWLAGILLIYILFKKFVHFDYLNWLQPIFSNTKLVFTVFMFSEVLIGIIPPEFFFIWALRYENLSDFIAIVLSLALISYGAGIIGYFIGRYLNRTLYYRYLKIKFLRQMDRRLQQFGLYLIIIAAITPIPFSGTAMLVGSVRYPFIKYLIFSLSRIVRFGIYAWVFWETRIHFI